ncbi:MAG: thiamine-phosphate kinase, partial [Fibrobacterales bacterium]|nr:thiamine-phosphate kinase [Fibrobacterales bacterium]
LGSEANHLARESGVRIVLDMERLPAPEGLAELASGLGLGLEETVLSSGEEYQLLFTSSAPASAIETIFKEKGLPAEPRRIGVVERGEGVFGRRADGALVPVAAQGWSHF